MGEVIELDLHGTLERIIRRDFGSTKFVLGCYIGEEHLATCISEDLDRRELAFLITELQRRYRELHE